MTIDFLIGALRASRDIPPTVMGEIEEILQKQETANPWERIGLIGKKTGLFNCGRCFKCWTAERSADLYKQGYHYCPNCGAKMEEDRR